MKNVHVTFRTSSVEDEAIAAASATWPEADGNRSELIRRILADWYRQRESNGGKTDRIIKAIKETEFTILEAISHVQPPLH